MTDGSQPLDPKREKFIEHLLNGDSAANAYSKVFPKAKPESAETAGPAMRREVQVGFRFDYLQKRIEDKVVEEFAWTKIDALNWLKTVVDTPIGAVGKDHPLCQEYGYTSNEHGGSERFKMPGKMDAVKTIGDWLKWNAPQQHEIIVESREEWVRRIRGRKED